MRQHMGVKGMNACFTLDLIFVTLNVTRIMISVLCSNKYKRRERSSERLHHVGVVAENLQPLQHGGAFLIFIDESRQLFKVDALREE